MSLASSSTTSAETAKLIGEWPGYPRESPSAIEIVGDRAYLATVSGLSILDATDPAALNFLGYVELTYSGAWDVAVSGNRAVLCFGSLPIRVVDVTDPAAPVETLTIDFQGPWTWAIQVSGQYAYASQMSDGLRILDLDAAGGPRVIQTVNTVARGRLEFRGDRGYLPTSSGLNVYSFTDSINALPSGAYAAGVSASHVALNSDRGYLAATDGLHILDIVPANPQQLGFYPTPDEALTVRVEGNRAYLTCDDKSVKVIDVTSPSSPVLLGQYQMTGAPRGLGVRLAHAMVLNNNSIQGITTMETVDLTDPAQPVLVDERESTGTATEVKLDGTLAYVADGQVGLSIVNVQEPQAPVLHGVFSQPGESVLCVDQSGPLACIGVDFSLRVIDVSNPSNPNAMGNYPTMGPVSQVQMAGDRVYTVSGFGMGELEVISLVNPSQPSRLGGYMIFADVHELEEIGGFAVLAEGPIGLEVVDCTNPTMPVQADLYAPGDSIYDVHLVVGPSQTHAFLATGNGLDIVDISDPRSVMFVSHWGEPGSNARHVFVEGGRTFLQGQDTLWILDTSTIVSPQLLGEVLIDLGDLVASGDLLYSPAGSWGLQVYRVVPNSTGSTLNYSSLPNNQLRLNWSDAGTGWTLQYLDDLSALPNWQGFGGSPEVTQWDVQMTGTRLFFRLMK